MGKTWKHPEPLTFYELITKYSAIQKAVVSQVKGLASSLSVATPGKFLLLQFSMSQVSQVGDSMTNLIATLNSMISTAVRNQKSG
jgi:hypothetical protein